MITKYNNYIKESFSTKIDIKNWLDKMEVKKYIINKDLTVDVHGRVYINHKNLTEIPVKFNKVDGDFDCSNNNLTSLEGCPNIVNGHLSCYNNYLYSLRYCPTIIKGYFFSINNRDLLDINDLNSEILIKNISNIKVSEEVFDKYFEYWIDKDFNIFNVLKDRVSDKIKQKYSHLFQANKFDLL